MPSRFIPLAALLVAAWGGSKAPPACGIAAIAGPAALINEFGTPGQTLASPPATLPERLVARLATGPAYRAVTGRQAGDSMWVIGVDGTLPPRVKVSYGVLVLDQSEHALGVMLFEDAPVAGAAHIGTVTMGGSTVPLLGVQTDPTRFEDPRCPFFPDSVIRT